MNKCYNVKAKLNQKTEYRGGRYVDNHQPATVKISDPIHGIVEVDDYEKQPMSNSQYNKVFAFYVNEGQVFTCSERSSEWMLKIINGELTDFKGKPVSDGLSQWFDIQEAGETEQIDWESEYKAMKSSLNAKVSALHTKMSSLEDELIVLKRSNRYLERELRCAKNVSPTNIS